MAVPQTQRTIVAMTEADLAAPFEGLPSVESIETGREDGTGNWASSRTAERYVGHAYAKVTVPSDDDEALDKVYRTAKDADTIDVTGVGYHHIRVREGRPPLPENRTRLDAWDSLREGDRFTVGMSVPHEARHVERDDEGHVRRVEAIPVYRIEKDAYEEGDSKEFLDATYNGVRRVQPSGSPATESRNVSITEMDGEFIIPDAE